MPMSRQGDTRFANALAVHIHCGLPTFAKVGSPQWTVDLGDRFNYPVSTKLQYGHLTFLVKVHLMDCIYQVEKENSTSSVTQ